MKHTMQILRLIPFIKLKNNSQQQLNGEKWDGKLNHLSVFVLPSAWKNGVEITEE